MNKDAALLYSIINSGESVKKAMLKGDLIDFRWLKNIVGLSTTEFSYTGLPENLTSDIVETSLCFMNKLCWYNSLTLGLVLCRYVPLGTYDIYLRPENVKLLSISGKTIAESVPFKDIVLFKDNRLDIIPAIVLFEYIGKMGNIEDTLFKNIELLKLPLFAKGSKENINTYKSIIKKMLNLDPIALVDIQVPNSFESVNVSFPASLTEQFELFKGYHNMALESMGIYSNASQKKERLLVDEVTSQTEYVDFIYQEKRDCRKMAIEEVNRRWGYNIELVENYREIRDEAIKDAQEMNAVKLINNEEHKEEKEDEA